MTGQRSGIRYIFGKGGIGVGFPASNPDGKEASGVGGRTGVGGRVLF